MDGGLCEGGGVLFGSGCFPETLRPSLSLWDSVSFAPSFIRTHANALFPHYSLDLRHPCIIRTVAKYLS